MMKLGTQTGSLTNHILSRAVIGQPTPKVGMGATLLSWTERYPATITEVMLVGKSYLLTVREDNAVRTDTNGMSECQTYEYSPNPNGALRHFRQAATGAWYEVSFNPKTKRWNKVNGLGLRIGERGKYYDFSF